jgi:hypothetical protein
MTSHAISAILRPDKCLGRNEVKKKRMVVLDEPGGFGMGVDSVRFGHYLDHILTNDERARGRGRGIASSSLTVLAYQPVYGDNPEFRVTWSGIESSKW